LGWEDWAGWWGRLEGTSGGSQPIWGGYTSLEMGIISFTELKAALKNISLTLKHFHQLKFQQTIDFQATK